MANKYVTPRRLSTFLDNLKNVFASLGHKHTTSDITDYKVDSELSSTSNNPVANKVLDAEFDAIAESMNALDLAIDGKADSSHTHDSRYYTESEIDSKLSTVNTSITNITSGSTPVKEAEHAESADTATNATNAEHAVNADSATSATSATKATQDASGNVITSHYETKSDATAKLNEAKSYTDTVASGKSDTTHNHDSDYDAKGSAADVQSNLDVVSDTLDSHTGNSNIHVTTTNKSQWNTAYTHSQAAHARTDATKVEDSTTNGNIKINGTETNVYSHPNSGVTAGTYKSVTVNAQGHVTSGTNPTTLSGYGITDAETKTDASAKLTEAKTYADSAATKVKNDLLNGAGTAYDTLKELGDLIDDNVDAISALETVAAGKANATHSHAISDVTNLQSTLDGKAAKSHGTHVSYSTTAPVMDGTASVGSASTVARSDHKHPTDTSRASKTEFDTHVADTTKHITSTERTNWNAAKTHADSAHAPSNAEKNQNAFSNVKVGTTTIAADTTTDTLELVGSNVTITPDATNDKITIAVADGSTSTKGIVKLTNSTSSTSTTTAATPSAVKSAYDLANTAKTNATTAQSKADSAYSLAESKVDSLSDLGITATATELNYIDGVTSKIQTQLDTLNSDLDTLTTTVNGKSDSSHTHSASKITSGILAVERGGTGNMDGYVRAGQKDGTSIGALATAEGRNVTASGSYCHAEGNYTYATGSSSHAEGQSTEASGSFSHAEGESSKASGYAAHAEGDHTIASGDYSHAQGKYNIEDTTNTYAHIVGNGESASARSNAHTLDWDGNAWFAGDVYVGGTTQDEGSPLVSKSDLEWEQIYDSGAITEPVNAFANIDISGYKKLRVVVKCVNDGTNSTSKNGAVTFTATNGTTYQFPCWTTMFTNADYTSGNMATFEINNGWLVCSGASRMLKTSNFLGTEGGTADNLPSTGSGIMRCTSKLSTMMVSALDQDTNYYLLAGSRVIVWGSVI